MARRKARGGSRQVSAKSRKAAPAAAPAVEVEVVEEAGGEGFESGIAIITTVVLVLAIVFIDMLKAQYGEGMFF